MEKEIVYRPERPEPDPARLKEEIERLGRLLNAVQLSNPPMMRKFKVLFLDFDGPLAIPWAVNEDPWPQIPGLIREVASRPDVALCLVSFNPGAEAAISRWGIRNCFAAVRAGCNWKLRAGEQYTEAHRKNLSKSAQIRSILENELEDSSYEVDFFDDDAKNLLDVYEQFGGAIKCFYVHEGLNRELLSRFLN